MRLDQVTGPVLILGVDTYSESVIDLLRHLPERPRVTGFLDCGLAGSLVGQSLQGIPILDRIEAIELYADRVEAFLLAIADPVQRESLFAALDGHSVPICSAIHPSAQVPEDCHVGRGSLILSGVSIGGGVRLGQGVSIGSGSVLEPGSRVGDFSRVDSRAVIGTSCRVGERVQIGKGAIVHDGVLGGPDAVVGLGSAVMNDIPSGTAVSGSPARPVGRGPTHPEEVIH